MWLLEVELFRFRLLPSPVTIAKRDELRFTPKFLKVVEGLMDMSSKLSWMLGSVLRTLGDANTIIQFWLDLVATDYYSSRC